VGIEPDEIDIADGDTGSAGEGTGGEGIDTGADESDSTGDGDTGVDTGDGDGDSDTTGDGDTGTTTTGDGDTTTTGDGDGDTGTDTGDGDGDTGSMDEACESLSPEDVVLGVNEIVLLDGPSMFASDCGGDGPEQVYRFTADDPGEYEFSVDAMDFLPALYVVSGCDPLAVLDCAAEPAALSVQLGAGETVYVVVDSIVGVGPASLTVSLL
jgi:hypothetical protein